MKKLLVMAFAAFVMHAAPAQAGMPELRYQPPPDFSRSAITPPEDYSANEFNAGLQVYPFRPFNGDIEQAFRRSLLREWIDPRFQETNLAAPPEFRPFTVPPGAQMAATMRVETATARPPMAWAPGPEGRTIAGLYMGTKSKYVVNLNRAAGYGSQVMALHYCLDTVPYVRQ